MIYFIPHALIHNYYIYIIVLMYEYAHAQLLYLYNSLSACVRARTHVQLLYLYNSLSTWYDLQLISILSRYDLRSRPREASSIVARATDRRSLNTFLEEKQLVWAELIEDESLCALARVRAINLLIASWAIYWSRLSINLLIDAKRRALVATFQRLPLIYLYINSIGALTIAEKFLRVKIFHKSQSFDSKRWKVVRL